MIKFESIKYKNFLSNGDQATTIVLNKTITSVFTGKNGAGKSTFIDAIVYALFGKPYRKVRLGQLINNINEKELVTEVVFTIGSKRYKVIRGMKPSVFEIYVNDVMIEQPATTSDYQTILENDILKLNYKTFNQIIILGSASFVPFMQLKLGDRREVIENLLDISVFSEMNVILKEKIKAVNSELIDAKHKIELTKERYKSKRAFMNEAIANYQTRTDDLTTKIKEIEELIGTTKSMLEAQQVEALHIMDKIKEFGNIEEKVTELSRSIETLSRELFEMNKNYGTFKSDAEGAELIDKKIEENDKKLVSARSKLKSLKALWLSNTKILDDFESVDDRDDVKRDIAVTTSQIKSDRKRLAFYETHSDCPECTQSIEPMFRESTIDDLTTDIKTSEAVVTDRKKRLKVIENTIIGKTQVESTVADIDNSIVDTKNYITRLIEANKTLTETKDQRIIKTSDELEAMLKEINALQEDIESKKTVHIHLKKENDELTKYKEGLIVIEKDIALYEHSAHTNQLGYDILKEEIDEHKVNPACTITQEEIDELAQEIKDLDKDLGKKNFSLHYFGIVQRLLKDDGLKTKIIKKFLPIINATANKYLDDFDFPINFEFDENFNETIQSNHRNDFCYYSFSEGEKARIDLALLFTWREIALKKSRNATNIIIFDEIFDGSLDIDGIENFMSILGLDEEGYNSFIISHKDDTINSRFDRHIDFVKDGHFSKMMETL